MGNIFLNIIIIVYFLAAGGLMLYGLNCYVMIFLFRRRRKEAARYRKAVLSWFNSDVSPDEFPQVTTQIPVFNEVNVVERIIRAASKMRYPQGKHDIQILDDSTDETRLLIDKIVSELRGEGHDISILRRTGRVGFKAGALCEGLKHAKGGLIAVFDADFVPPADYLLGTVPFFLADKKLGLVQARWGHLNHQGVNHVMCQMKKSFDFFEYGR